MATGTKHETTIEADPKLPTIRMVRDFDAPPERVFRAWTDPELFVKWTGPNDTTTRVDRWDASTGGHYRYVSEVEGEDYGFFGSFHEVRPAERLVQTFCYEGFPDSVALETMTFTDLGDGRTRITTLSVYDTMEGRDGIISAGMETGVVEGYEKLDALLAGE